MIAQLGERVGIYRADAEADGQGGEARAWSFAFAAWAGVVPIGESTSESLVTRRRYRFTLRYRTDLPEPARLVWNSRHFSVLASSDPDLRGERLHLICEEL